MKKRWITIAFLAVLLIVVGLAEIGHSRTRGKLLSEVRNG